MSIRSTSRRARGTLAVGQLLRPRAHLGFAPQRASLRKRGGGGVQRERNFARPDGLSGGMRTRLLWMTRRRADWPARPRGLAPPLAAVCSLAVVLTLLGPTGGTAEVVAAGSSANEGGVTSNTATAASAAARRLHRCRVPRRLRGTFFGFRANVRCKEARRVLRNRRCADSRCRRWVSRGRRGRYRCRVRPNRFEGADFRCVKRRADRRDLVVKFRSGS